MIEFFEFQLRPRVLYKAGLVGELGQEVARLAAAPALLVAGERVARVGLLDRVIAGLNNSVPIAGVFAEVPPNPTVAVVERAAASARAQGVGLIVAVGGRAPLDTAKCLRILLSEEGSLREYEGYNRISRPLIPMIAIPTTAGSGSEVAPFAVIRDEQSRTQLTFASPFLAPDLAILDPELTRALPQRLTASSGIDALTHAIEAFVSADTNPVSESLALYAIDMISTNLRAATYNGDDLYARGQMLIAACMAGMATVSGFLGIVHALAHAVGGAFDVHHGIANAILLPHGMRFNSFAVPNRFQRIARALGVNAGGRAEEDVIADGIAAVRSLVADCMLPTRLRDIDVPEDALPVLAEAALADVAIFTNPRPVTSDEMMNLLREAW